jgi:hypothetical protein
MKNWDHDTPIQKLGAISILDVDEQRDYHRENYDDSNNDEKDLLPA